MISIKLQLSRVVMHRVRSSAE